MAHEYAIKVFQPEQPPSPDMYKLELKNLQALQGSSVIPTLVAHDDTSRAIVTTPVGRPMDEGMSSYLFVAN
jgi:hypothetical protein